MIPDIFNNFPKIRKELPEAYLKIYDSHYKKNRSGETTATSLSMKLERWLHKKVAEDVKQVGAKTLEIGAGTLNQMEYEPKVEQYDIIEPFHLLYENSPQLPKVKTIYKDINEVDDLAKYQRITSVATFEHILDLPLVVAKSVMLLEPNGSLRVSIPNEGTLLWKLGTLVTGFEFKRMYNLDYGILLEHEHVNTAIEIETVLKYFFTDIKTKVFGINRKLAFYVFFDCKKPEVERAKQYLELRNRG